MSYTVHIAEKASRKQFWVSVPNVAPVGREFLFAEAALNAVAG
jgi:hypothetical protein